VKWIAAALLLSAATAALAAADPVQPLAPRMEFTPPAPGSYTLQKIQRTPDGSLLDHRGRTRRLDELTRGKVTLLTFFYTYCTDAWGCPFAYRVLTELRARVAADAAHARRVRFVNVSFDPTHDTPDALRLYAGRLVDNPRFEWQFLTARNMRELLPLLDDFGQDVRVEVDERGRPTRTIHHMLKLFLIDAHGVVREIYALDYLHPELLYNDIVTLLAEERGAAPAQLSR